MASLILGGNLCGDGKSDSVDALHAVERKNAAVMRVQVVEKYLELCANNQQ